MLVKSLTVVCILWLVCISNISSQNVLQELDDDASVTTPTVQGMGQLNPLLGLAKNLPPGLLSSLMSGNTTGLSSLLSSPAVNGLLSRLPNDTVNQLKSGNLSALQSLMSSPMVQGLLGTLLGGNNPAVGGNTPSTSSNGSSMPSIIQTVLNALKGDPKSIQSLMSSPAVQGVLKSLPPDAMAALMSGNMTAIGSILSSPQIQSMVQSMMAGATGQSSLGALSIFLDGGVTGYIKKIISDDAALKYFKVRHMCVKDFKTVTDSFMAKQGWAIQMVDAMGKLDAGFLYNFNSLKKLIGDYDECLGIEIPEEDFQPKYCRTKVSIITDALLEQLKGVSIYVGTCVSTRCNANDIDGLLKTAQYVLFNQSFQFWPESECPEEPEVDNSTKAVIYVLSVLGVFMLIGTLYDVIVVQLDLLSSSESERSDVELTGVHNMSYVEGEPSEKANGAVPNGIHDKVSTQPLGKKPDSQKRSVLGQIILSFSVYTNGVKILNASQGSGSLGAVNGIRFLSMGWVILGHTYFFSNGYDENLYTFFGKKSKQWTFMFIPYATVSVDSFFALSGILVAYLTLRELKKVGSALKFNWPMYYFHRFWRLTPPYMLILMVGTVLVPFMSDGPMWNSDESQIMKACKDNWWINLLYVNNYVKTNEMCMGWSWYLANDMQFYIISPLILLPLFYFVGAGVAIGIVLTLASMIATGVIATIHHYPVQMGVEDAPEAKDGDYMKNIYFPSYARIGPYIVGLFTGYLLYKLKCKCKIPKLLNLSAWIVCFGVCCAIIYSPFNNVGKHVMGVSESAAYMALTRTVWGVAVCWVVFSCACGYGGWINELLSWKPFIPLGRLTYCAYLVHPLCISIYASSLRRPFYFTDYSLTYLFFGNIVTAYAVAFLCSLAFESPMMALEKAIFRRGK